MKFLSIGEFARATRLSPKALRLYDELGLLPPSRVDQWSGYRYYAPSQLEQARLIAWLRRLGMPLAAITEVVGLPPAQAADRVAALLRVAEADFAERKELAEFLISYLSGKDTAMSAAAMPASVPLTIRFAGSDPGKTGDQDVAYADSGLLAVAPFGPDGERFGATVMDSLRQYSESVAGPTAPAPADVLNAMSDALTAAAASVRPAADGAEPAADSGSLLTAMFWYGSQLSFVHIGDSRAYLLRDGALFQVTHDASGVQSMIDDGRLTPAEAVSYPQRLLLLTALDAAARPVSEPMLRDARAGDRYLLCTDGVATVVPVAIISQTLRDTMLSPEGVVARLMNAAGGAGADRAVACTVADVMAAA